MDFSSIKPPQWFYLSIVILALIIILMMTFFEYKFHFKDGEFGFAKKDFYDSIVVDGQCFKPINVYACHRSEYSDQDHFLMINGSESQCKKTSDNKYEWSGYQSTILAKTNCK